MEQQLILDLYQVRKILYVLTRNIIHFSFYELFIFHFHFMNYSLFIL